MSCEDQFSSATIDQCVAVAENLVVFVVDESVAAAGFAVEALQFRSMYDLCIAVAAADLCIAVADSRLSVVVAAAVAADVVVGQDICC